MTDQQAALTLDRALDGERGFDLNGSQPLLTTAETVQTLFDRQKGIPTELFLMQLECQLFPSVDNPASSKSSPAPAMPVRRPSPIGASRKHRFSHLLAAIAAALLLFFGGAAAIIFEGFGLQSSPEPSAIPAIGFGTAEASPEPVGELWKVDPPKGDMLPDRPGIIVNGLLYRSFFSGGWSIIQAIDLQTGTLRWEQTPRVGPSAIDASEDLLLVTGGNGEVVGIRYELIALDSRTGEERWSESLAQEPVGLLVKEDRIFVLGNDNLLEAFDLKTQQRLWQVDLGRFVDPSSTSRVNSFGDFTGDRLAAADGNIAAVLGNGRLVAVGASDGRLRWANERTTEGWTRVTVIDGKFVVIAFGGETLMYDPEATPLPITPGDPAGSPCTTVIEARTSASPETVPGIGETVDSFDPATGTSPWGVKLPEQYFVSPVDESQFIVQVEQVQSAGIADDGELFPCLIDGSTGAVSETTGDAFVDFILANADTGEKSGVGATPRGAPFWAIDLDPATMESLPTIDLKTLGIDGLRWVQKVNGLILITAQDGTLVGFSANHKSQTPQLSGTPATAETANSGIDWIANGPEGSEYQSAWEWTAGDGRIFRTIGAGTGWSHIQAVDTEDGSILWDLPSPVTGYLYAKDDLLLVAGQDGQSLKIESVLVALNAQTGDEVWRASISQLPVGMKVVGDRAYILGADNNLDAIDLNTHALLYVRSIGADSKPRKTIVGQSVSPTHRMAIVGNTLVAVLADGSLARVELETGKVMWSSLTDVPRRVWIYDFGGHLVTVDGGAWEDITGASSTFATPLPEPASCLEAVVPDEQDGSTANFTRGRETLRGIDLATGTQTWAAAGALGLNQLLDSDQGPIFMVNTPPADVPATRSQMSVCQIDPTTGDVHQVDDLSSLTSATFQVAFTDDEGDELAVGVLSDGRYLALPADLIPEWAGPSVDLQMSTSQPGFAWTAVIDGQVYASLQDGRLVKVHSDQSIPTPADAAEPPQLATPIASDAGWLAHGPDAIADFVAESTHAISDGRIFRAFAMKIGRPHVQAIDADTGDVLWDVEIQFGGDLMEATGDLLLVNEGSYTLVAQVAALDVTTGQEVWAAPLSDYPVAMAVTANWALVLGSSGRLDVIDLETGQTVYSVDIRGDAQNAPPSTLRDLTAQRNRLAVDGETLYATLADGSVVAVDLETGVPKWWSLRATPGQVDVYVIDGAVVTIDMGDLDAINAQLEEEREAALSGTPAAIATPMLDPTLPSCNQPPDGAPLKATPGADAVPGPVITTYRGLEPNTGEVRWSTVLPEQSFRLMPVDGGVLYLIVAAGNGGTTLPQLGYCFVDASTGQGYQVNPVDKVPGRVLKLEIPGWPGDDRAFIIGEGLPLLVFPFEYMADMTVPVVVLDETVSDGWRWDEIYKDRIYFSLTNGDLVMIPIPSA